MLPSYFDYAFVHLRQKECLRPELSPKFLSTLGPNPARTRPEPAQTRPENPGPNPIEKSRPDLQLCARKPNDAKMGPGNSLHVLA